MSAIHLPYNPPRYAWARIAPSLLIALGLLTFAVAIETTVTCPKENILFAGESGGLIVTEKHEGIIVGSKRECHLNADVFQMPLPLLSQIMMFTDNISDKIEWYKSELLRKLADPQS